MSEVSARRAGKRGSLEAEGTPLQLVAFQGGGHRIPHPAQYPLYRGSGEGRPRKVLARKCQVCPIPTVFVGTVVGALVLLASGGLLGPWMLGPIQWLCGLVPWTLPGTRREWGLQLFLL